MDNVVDRIKGKEKVIAALIAQAALVILLYITTGTFNYQEVLAIVMGALTALGVYETTNRPPRRKRSEAPKRRRSERVE
jgi:hypothetical protein